MTDKPLQGQTILFTENEPLILLDTSQKLRDAGADVLASAKVEETLALIRENEISAAVLNVNLGDADCSEVYENLVERDVPVAIVTGYSEEEISQKWPKAAYIP